MKSREEIRIQQGKLETENNVFKLNFNYIKSIDLIKKLCGFKTNSSFINSKNFPLRLNLIPSKLDILL